MDGDTTDTVTQITVQVIACQCGNNKLMLIMPCEIYCPDCLSVIETLRWVAPGNAPPRLDG